MIVTKDSIEDHFTVGKTERAVYLEYRDDPFPPRFEDTNLTFSKSDLSNLNNYKDSIWVEDDIEPNPDTG